MSWHTFQVELRQLNYFVAVANEKSFTLAAKRLHVVQSAVSAAIASLERDLRVTLFERNAQRVHRHLKQGHPVRMILAAETRIRADLIVMSKRSRSKVEDALIGSTTKRVVLDAHGDVLVVPLLAGDAARER